MPKGVSSTRQYALDKLRIDLIQHNQIQKDTLRYFIEHNISLYAPDVKEVFRKFKKTD